MTYMQQQGAYNAAIAGQALNAQSRRGLDRVATQEFNPRRSYQPSLIIKEIVEMAIMFVGHRLHYICDTEADIDPTWDVGACIYVIGSNKNYVMCSGGGCAFVGQLQSDWSEATTSAADYIKNKPAIPSVIRTASSLSLALVGAGATGTQISATKDSTVRVNVSTSTTSTIGGPSTSVITLKKCATNSAIEGDWTVGPILENDQTITLAIVLNSIQALKAQLSIDVPAGWFVKLVASGTGTHTEAFISAEKTVYG